MKHATQVAAYGRARQDDWCLGTHRTTKPNRNGRGYDTAPAVVRLDVTLLSGYGKEYLCHPMTNVITHDSTNKDRREEDTYHGVYEIEQVGLRDAELMGQQILNLGYEPLQEQSGKSSQHADDESEQQDESFFLDAPLAPNHYPGPGILNESALIHATLLFDNYFR